MEKPLISVVIPAYNEERYLGYALSSLLDQDFPKEKYEIVVVDNGSTDKTVEIGKAFAVKILHEPRKGAVFARQKGTLAAQGRIIVSFDADSQASPHFLSQIAKNFANDSKAIAVAGLYLTPDMPLLSRIYLEFFLRSLIFLSTKIFGSPFYISATNFSFKKDVFLKAGGYPVDGGRLADQYLFLKKLKKIGKIIFDPNLMVTTSARRLKGRLLASVVKDGVTYTYLDPFFYKLTKHRLPGGVPDLRP